MRYPTSLLAGLGALLCAACVLQPTSSSDTVEFRLDPQSGMCVPVPAPGTGIDAGTATPLPWKAWARCADPCAGLGIADCKADPRCVVRSVDGKVFTCEANPALDRCLGLDEKTCSATAGCQAVYGGEPCACDGGMPGGDPPQCACPDARVYRGCTATPVTPPPPASCTSDEGCGADLHCSVSDGDCRPFPGCEKGMACPAVCTGVCVKDTGPPPAAHCYDPAVDRILCKALPPTCASGTVPEVSDNCWTSQCVPKEKCVVAAGCFAIADERRCIARTDCEPVYSGSRCFCDAEGCGCLDYAFASCRPRPVPLPLPPPPTCDPAAAPVATVTGSWASTPGDLPERRYVFDASGSFLQTDLVAPCPPDAVCVWSGIIENRGKWAMTSATPAPLVSLFYAPPRQGEGQLKFAATVSLKGCGADLRLVETETGRVLLRAPATR